MRLDFKKHCAHDDASNVIITSIVFPEILFSQASCADPRFGDGVESHETQFGAPEKLPNTEARQAISLCRRQIIASVKFKQKEEVDKRV